MNWSRVAWAVLMTTAIQTGGQAQEDQNPTLKAGPAPATILGSAQPDAEVRDHGLGVSLTVDSRAMFPAAFAEGGGRLATLQLGGRLKSELPLLENLVLTVGLGSRWTHYDFDDAFELDAQQGDPWSTVHQGDLELGLRLRWSELSVFASGSLGFHREEGAALSSALTVGAVFGVMYAFNKTLSAGLGVSIRSRLEDSLQVLPVPLFNLRVDLDARWRFELGLPRGARVVFTPVEVLDLSLGLALAAAFGAGETRLDNRGLAPRGIFKHTSLPVELSADWRPAGKTLELSVGVGLIAYQKLEIENSRGHKISDVHSEPTGYASLTLRLRF